MRDITKRAGVKIRALRRLKGLTQEQVAEAAQINHSYYGRIERGEANVSLELLAAIAEALDVRAATLLDADSDFDDLDKVKNIIISSLETMNGEQLRILAALLSMSQKK
jgi:transcriptional regulator with XRE-family HTH domain